MVLHCVRNRVVEGVTPSGQQSLSPPAHRQVDNATTRNAPGLLECFSTNSARSVLARESMNFRLRPAFGPPSKEVRTPDGTDKADGTREADGTDETNGAYEANGQRPEVVAE